MRSGVNSLTHLVLQTPVLKVLVNGIQAIGRNVDADDEKGGVEGRRKEQER